MRNRFLFLLFGIVFFACQKDADPTLEETKKDCRITKIIQGVNNGAADDTTFTFTYDSKGLLSKITYTKLNSTSYDWIMHYDDQNRLVKIAGPKVIDFVYNSKGLLSEVSYAKLSAMEKLVFEYGADSVPSSSRRHRFMGGQWQDQGQTQYTYQNGNIVTAGKSTFEYYNNIPNGFKLLSLIDMDYIGIAGSYETFFYFNKNMVKKANRIFDGYHINYSIDSNNIVKSVSTWFPPNSTDSGMRETRSFFYECK